MRLVQGPLPHSVFNPAPPTVGTTTDVPRPFKPDTSTIVAWLLIGGVFLLFCGAFVKSMVTSADDTEDQLETESRDHLENRRDAIDQITDNARDSVEAIADGTGEPAAVVIDNAQATVDIVSSESITEIQNVANQAKTDFDGDAS